MMKIEIEEFLDKTLSDFFPKNGLWERIVLENQKLLQKKIFLAI